VSVAFWVLAVTVVANGLIAGASFDVATVKLPTRRRIGSARAGSARDQDVLRAVVDDLVLVNR